MNCVSDGHFVGTTQVGERCNSPRIEPNETEAQFLNRTMDLEFVVFISTRQYLTQHQITCK